jgi:hypothetical protein
MFLKYDAWTNMDNVGENECKINWGILAFDSIVQHDVKSMHHVHSLPYFFPFTPFIFCPLSHLF